MLDHYVKGSATRLSPEAPVPVVLKQKDEYFLGGAGNVFSNVVSMGAKCDLLSVIGNDVAGDHILSLIEERSGNMGVLIRNSDRKTTTKMRVLANSHQLVRIDSEDTTRISSEMEYDMMERFDSIYEHYDGIILEDYNKGVLTHGLIRHILDRCYTKQIPVLVDPKNDNILSYYGATIFKPNLSEFAKMVGVDKFGDDLFDLHSYMMDFKNRMGLDVLVVTLSERGIIYAKDGETVLKGGYPVNVADVSGAGDSVSAMLLLSYLSGIDIENVVSLCNITGAIACSKIGAAAISLKEVLENPNINYLK
jgi:rfaE bifunctional protein kinase chain/domain